MKEVIKEVFYLAVCLAITFGIWYGSAKFCIWLQLNL
jgi:hypothetical protein